MSMNRDTDLLLQSGIAAVRSGDKREGARLLAQVVRKEPQSEDAWFWLAAATDQPAEAAACLRRVLAINPNNGRARQALNMLDTGQGQAAFNTGPLEPGPNPDMGNRPLSTGDLISPYNTPSEPVIAPVPAPPPPSFGATNPYNNELAPSPVAPPPFAWSPPNGNAEAPVDPYSVNDPYNVNTMPSPAQSNLPPPPPFMGGGGGVRLGHLDPNAPAVPNNLAFAGPTVSDPGAELRASLLPITPVNAAPYPPANGQTSARRGLFGRRKNVVVVPGQVVVVKKKRRLNPLFLVLAILIIILAGLIGYFLMQKPATNTVAEVPAADQTATAVALTATVLSGTPGANGTAGAGTVSGTPGGATGPGGVSGSAAANGTPGVGGTVANGTPGIGTGGIAANGTPGINGTGGANVTAGAGTSQAGLPTPTPQNGTAAPGTSPANQTGPTATAASGTSPNTGTGGEFPGGTPAPGTTPRATPAGLGPDVPPATVRDNRPPPEVVSYVNKTANYLNNSQFFEAAVAEGIVKPYRAGRIKPGVTLINLPQIRIPGGSVNFIPAIGTPGTTPGAQPTTTPNPTVIAGATPGPTTTTNPSGDNVNPQPANGTPGTAPPGSTPRATTAPTTTAPPANTPVPGSTRLAAGNIPPGAVQYIYNGPNGPELYYLVNFSGAEDMSSLTLSLGQLARVLKDQPVPAGGYELNQVALEYANDLAYMANSLDRFFQTGQISNLEDLANYYDKAVRDRERWAKIVAAGYPFRIIL